MSAAFLVAFVGVLLAFQPLSTDLYLPSVPVMAQDLGLSLVVAQGSFLAYLVGFALGQLPAGALADRLGRRPVLVWAAALYTFAALAGALANGGAVLLASRVVLGLSVAAMAVAGRAAIRDGFDPEAGEQALAKGFAGMGISAVVAGAAGGELAHLLSWRMVMALLAVGGAALWLWTWWGFRPAPIAPPVVADSAAPSASGHGSPLKQILGNSTFWFSTLVASASFSEAVCFVGGSSLVLPKYFGASPATLGWTLTICSTSFLLSTFVCQWMLKRWGGRVAMRWSSGVAIVAAGLFALASTLQGEMGLICLVVAQMTYMQCHGANQICGQASAVAPFPDHAGLAAAWSGTIMILIGVLCGQAQSMWLAQGLHHMPMVLMAIALASSALAWRQSRNEPSH
jgi:DHA1 family bicyclomycin/chloramphenicol resistance-like MFS transporter